MQSQIIENYKKVLENIEKTANSVGRKPEDIKLVAVSKLQPVEKIKLLINNFNHTDFGENRVQELIPKYKELPNVNWHLIGHLQTNKVNKLLREAPPYLIHSLDRERLAEKIDKQAKNLNITINCLIEVKISQDETKHGISPEDVEKLITTIIEKYTNISLLGYMGMATFTDKEKIIRKQFSLLREIRDKYLHYSTEKHPLQHLSMGMTNDYIYAIKEGATILRVGSAIFST